MLTQQYLPASSKHFCFSSELSPILQAFTATERVCVETGALESCCEGKNEIFCMNEWYYKNILSTRVCPMVCKLCDKVFIVYQMQTRQVDLHRLEMLHYDNLRGFESSFILISARRSCFLMRSFRIFCQLQSWSPIHFDYYFSLNRIWTPYVLIFKK